MIKIRLCKKISYTIIITDLDEFITREGIEYIINKQPKNYYFIKGTVYFPYYYHKLEDCYRCIVVRYNKYMTTLSKIRYFTSITPNNTLTFPNDPSKPLYTHCSYCFNSIEEYRNKFQSYTHQKFNKPPYITNDWIFKSHYCRYIVNNNINGTDEPYHGWRHLIPDDERLKYIIDRSFMLPINQTNYTEKDLDTLCIKKYNRTVFESSAKYIFN